MASQVEIQNEVREALIEALGVEDDVVVSEAVLTKDLGAESIDFLDIIFRLEKAFGLKIPRDDIYPQSIVSNKGFVENGKLKPAGLEALKQKYPYLNYSEIEARIDSFDMQDLFTVSMLESYIAHRLG